MMDVRDRVIKIETRMENLPDLEARVDKHGRDILKAHTSILIFRWLAGIAFVTLPATAYAVFRLFKG